jgi:predicted permease
MILWNRLRSWLHATLGRPAMETEMETEFRFHLEAFAEDLVARGVPREEALRRARLEFGAVERAKEECREARGVSILETFASDLRFGLRMLRKSPVFTATAVLTLALGIGANTAIFSMVDAFLLRPLPVKDAAQITALGFQQNKGSLQNAFSIPEFQDLQRDTSNIFSDVLVYQFGAGGVTLDGKTQPITVNYVSGSYFSMLGIKPELGRLILPSEGDPAVPNPVLVLGYNYWKTHFGGDPAIVGKSVLYDGHPATVIGVVPRTFHGLYAIVDAQGYLPIGMMTVDTNYPKDQPTNREMRDFVALARLRNGVRLSETQSALKLISDRMSREFPKSDAGISILAFPERLSRPQPDLNGTFPKMATLFLLLAALVLLLACVNVANFLLVRAAARQRELAIRAAMGGSRSRLIRQLLTESLVLALAGGVAGVFLGLAGSNFLASLQLRTTLPILIDFHFDWRIFAYALGAALITGFCVGIVPALRASNSQMLEIIREGGRSVTAARSWLRSGLVVAQVGGSLMLLIVAGLMTRSLAHVRGSDLGFDPQNLLNLTLDPNEIGYGKDQGLAFYKQLIQRVEALPGVQSASVAFSVPLGYYNNGDTVDIPGYEIPAGQGAPAISFNNVTPDYFRTMGMRILEGRAFDARDGETAQHVAIVSQTMASRFWPKTSAIGHQFSLVSDRAHPLTIVGVTNDNRASGLTGPIVPYFYVPFDQQYSSISTLQVRTLGPPDTVTASVRQQVADLAPTMPIFDVRSMIDGLETLNGFLVYELAAGLAGVLGILGVILAVVGVFGVISFTVSQRTHEIGIRMALGAQSRTVLRMVLRQGAWLIWGGLALGVVLALAIAQLVGNFLTGVSPFDPVTYITVTLGLTLVALLACYLPARRAASVDPLVALRYE